MVGAKNKLFDGEKRTEKTCLLILSFKMMPRETSKSLVSNKNQPLHIKELCISLSAFKRYIDETDCPKDLIYAQENFQYGKCLGWIKVRVSRAKKEEL